MAGNARRPVPQPPRTPRKREGPLHCERMNMATLLLIWDTLRRVVPDLLAAGVVGIGELACAWLWAVERCSGVLRPQDRLAIFGYVASGVRSMRKAIDQRQGADCTGKSVENAPVVGGVDAVEWMYRMLCWHCGMPSAEAAGKVKTLADAAVQRRPLIFHDDMPSAFEEARRASEDGLLSFSAATRACCDVLWNYRELGLPTLEEDWGLNEADAGIFCERFVEAMGVNSDMRITYEQYVACVFGRRRQEVVLNMYDITNGFVEAVSRWLPIRGVEAVEGLWHTGVVVFGREYSFAGSLVHSAPGDCAIGKRRKSVVLGTTWRRMAELHRFVYEELRTIYTRENYDLLKRNCNHFSDHISRWLSGQQIPEEVRRQPELATQIPLAIIGILGTGLNEWRLGSCKNDEADGAVDDAGACGGSSASVRPRPAPAKQADDEAEAWSEDLPEACHSSAAQPGEASFMLPGGPSDCDEDVPKPVTLGPRFWASGQLRADVGEGGAPWTGRSDGSFEPVEAEALEEEVRQAARSSKATESTEESSEEESEDEAVEADRMRPEAHQPRFVSLTRRSTFL